MRVKTILKGVKSVKKIFKILLVFLIVFVLCIGSLAIWQRKNIESIITGITQTEEEIIQRRDKNQEKLVSEVNTFLDEGLREPTEEEKSQLDDGTLKLPELYSKMFEEKTLELEKKRKENENKIKKDEIVSKYMAQLYTYQSEFEARAGETISQGAKYYNNLVKSKTVDKPTARAKTITHFTPIVNGVEAECDAKVETVIANLKKELEAIGTQTDIIGTIRDSYAREKQLKLSYYANKYLS